MTKILPKLLMVYICSCSILQAQRLWEIQPTLGNYTNLGMDTTHEHLLQQFKEEQSLDAAILLAFQYGESEKDLILDSLRIWAYQDTSIGGIENYFFYQKLRGYYGEQEAIQGLDTLIRQRSFVSIQTRLFAIDLLADAEVYNYFDTASTAYLNNNDKNLAMTVISKYGKNQDYSAQAESLLVQGIRASNDYKYFMGPAEAMARFNKQYTISVLNEFFESATGQAKKDFFDALEILDQDGQPERTIVAVSIEQNDTSRDYYYPMAGFVESKNRTNRYYEPFFIKFVSEQIVSEQSEIVRSNLKEFLDYFKPLPLPESLSVRALIDSLIVCKHQSATYSWVSDSNFVSELDSLLINARNFVLQEDSNNCYRQLKLFQQKIDQEFRDSLDGDNKHVTIEGAKFLFYYAKYILSRISLPPTQFLLTVSVDSNGSVFKSPDLALYDSATTVTLAATSSLGYGFSGWSGDVPAGHETKNPLLIVMNNDKKIKASFSVKK